VDKDRFIVKPFQIDDFSEVIDILQAVSAYKPERKEYDSLARRFASDLATTAYVCKKNNLVVGFASMFVITRIRGGRAAIVEDVAVSHFYRGEGIGKRLLLSLINSAQQQGCFKIELATSDSAIEFYRKIGFLESSAYMRFFFNE